jgi:hypothetical protein
MAAGAETSTVAMLVARGVGCSVAGRTAGCSPAVASLLPPIGAPRLAMMSPDGARASFSGSSAGAVRKVAGEPPEAAGARSLADAPADEVEPSAAAAAGPVEGAAAGVDMEPARF